MHDYYEAILAALIQRLGTASEIWIHDYIMTNVHDILHDFEFHPEYDTWVDAIENSVSTLHSQGFITFDKQTNQWSITPAGRQHYDTLRARS